MDAGMCDQQERDANTYEGPWDCPACALLSQEDKRFRLAFSEEQEMIHVTWQPCWEAAAMLNSHPDLKVYVDAYEQ